MAYFELGLRSNFSFLTGASHPQDYVEAAKATGLAGIGLADHNTVAGTVRLHVGAKAEGVTYHPGARLVFADDTPQLLAYPRNRAGWGRLCRLLSCGNLRAQKGCCSLFYDDLATWHEDILFILVPPSMAQISAFEGLWHHVEKLKMLLGDRLYLALVARYDGLDHQAFAALDMLAQKAGLRLIVSNDPLYHAPGRRPLADIVTAIREHVPLAQAGYRLSANGERYLKSEADMRRIFRHYLHAVDETVRFAARLDFSLDDLAYQYPQETVPGESPSETLRRLSYAGAVQRYGGVVPEKLAATLDYELALIGEKKYEPYFLTVYRIVQHARSRGILCQGRGSAANSAVCYCLGITEVDPQKSTLLFERFISIERDEPPDIDVDFEHARREEVIQHIYAAYGREHAGLAAAVISYRARSAGREVAKAFGLSEDVQTALSQSISGWWTKSYGAEQAKQAGLDMQSETTRRVLHYADELQSFPRHLSQHVGGFVITQDRLDEVVPIMNTADGRYMIEWDKDDLDSLKILKIDILALGMLTCLSRALNMLKSHYGIVHSLHSIMQDEQPAVYDMICCADTVGVFQIESRAQMSMLPRLRPRCFYDLVIEVAIVRPGPIQGNMVHPYLKRREDLRQGKRITYPSPALEKALKRTLGVPLFQEQAMQIAILAAGFTPAEADRLRRAMATFRRTGQVSAFREKMINGMLERGYERDFAERCFSQIEGFGEYGFPESHAASFALLVYVSCWFKAYYPDIFLTSLLNSQPMGFYPPAQLIRDAREHGVVVHPVDINHSVWESVLQHGNVDFSALKYAHRSMRNIIQTRHAVRLGFSLVKGLRQEDMAKLVAERGTGYASLRALWLKTGLSRSTIEKLAEADCFQSIGLSRRQALWEAKALEKSAALESLPLFAQDQKQKTQPETKHETLPENLIREAPVHLPRMKPGEEVIQDYRSMTFSLKAHPLSFLRERLAKQSVVQTAQLEHLPSGRKTSVAGLVLVRQRPGTAKGVIFMTVEDETGTANIIIWPKVLEKYRPVIMGARLICVRGRLQKQASVIHLVAQELEDKTADLGLLKQDIREFGLNKRADEVYRTIKEPRPHAVEIAPTIALSDIEPEAEPHTEMPKEPQIKTLAAAMPRGRNFH